jgi:hypothetical protein
MTVVQHASTSAQSICRGNFLSRAVVACRSRVPMGPFGEDQPDPHGSPGGKAGKPVFDDLGSVRIHAEDPVEPRDQSPELLKVGDLCIVEGLPGTHGQEQAVERIIAEPGGESGSPLGDGSGDAARGHPCKTPQRGLYSRWSEKSRPASIRDARGVSSQRGGTPITTCISSLLVRT